MEELRLHKKYSSKPRKEKVYRSYRSLHATVEKCKNCPFAVNTAIEIKDITATSGNTAQLLADTYPARCHYCRIYSYNKTN